MLSQLPVGAASMGELIFLVGRELGEGLVRPRRLEPGVPAEMSLAPRLHEDLPRGLAHEHVHLAAVPVADAALRAGGAVVERIRDRRETFAAGSLEQPANVRAWEIAELVEAQRYVLDNQALVALRLGDFEFV